MSHPPPRQYLHLKHFFTFTKNHVHHVKIPVNTASHRSWETPEQTCVRAVPPPTMLALPSVCQAPPAQFLAVWGLAWAELSGQVYRHHHLFVSFIPEDLDRPFILTIENSRLTAPCSLHSKMIGPQDGRRGGTWGRPTIR